jgi:hypothetical protein
MGDITSGRRTAGERQPANVSRALDTGGWDSTPANGRLTRR